MQKFYNGRMSENPPIQMNASALWREETFTDREVGTIRRMSPVAPDGTPDASRKAIFMGEAALMTPAGSLPLSFEIPAETLAQAVAAYGPALEKAYASAVEELQELRRRASSQIVIPQGGLPPGGLGPGGLAPGAAPGKIKLR
jgi:hypothetical protein